MFVSPEQQAVWARMVAENHPWLSQIRRNALYDNTPSIRYASGGRWSGLYYLISGDPAFAHRCFATVASETNQFQTPMKPGNATREHTIERVMMLDWISPELTPEEVKIFTDWLISTAEGCFEYGLRIVDSDQVCGTFGFFALLDTRCGTDYLTRSIKNGQGGKLIPLGGLDATGSDRTTYRNAIRRYIDFMASGGQWIESQEYNLGTVNLLYMTWQSLKTALPEDHLPEYGEWLPQARIYHRHELLPGLKEAFQWGDVQDVRGLRWVNRDTVYAGLRSRDPMFDQFAAEVDTANGRKAPDGNAIPMYPRFYYYADPYQARSPWVPETPLMFVTRGTGHAYWRTGWDTKDRATHFFCHAFSSGFVDHQPRQFGTLQVTRENLFLLDQPLGYGTTFVTANALIVCNRGPSREAGGLTESAGEPGVFAYAAGTNCGMGPDITATSYIPPATYLHENTRAVFELLDGVETVVVIADRVHTDDPRTQKQPNGSPSLARYPRAAQIRMKEARGLIDVLWHMPVAPTVTANGFAWLLPNSTWGVEVRQILPNTPFVYVAVDETVEVPGTVSASERKWCLHAIAPEPETVPTFQTILHVLVASEGTPRLETVPINESAVRGVMLMRPDMPSVAVVFSAKAGPIVTYRQADLNVVTTARRLDATFTLTLSQAAKVYLADLDPSIRWQATIGEATARLTPVGDLMVADCDKPGVLKLWANEEP